jgi:hypothetical protein
MVVCRSVPSWSISHDRSSTAINAATNSDVASNQLNQRGIAGFDDRDLC